MASTIIPEEELARGEETLRKYYKTKTYEELMEVRVDPYGYGKTREIDYWYLSFIPPP